MEPNYINQQFQDRMSYCPLSWASLNKGLEQCFTPKQLENSFGIIKNCTERLKNEIDLPNFIDMIQPCAESFRNFNTSNWNCLLNKIQILFPNAAQDPDFNQFKQNITSKFAEHFPDTKITTQAKQPHVFKNTDDELNSMSKSYQMSLSERLNNVPHLEGQKNYSEKASMLQSILNFLVLESDLINHTITYTDFVLEDVERLKKILEGAYLTILVRSNFVPFYEIPSDLESDEYAFWLQLAPLIDLSFDGNRTFANFKTNNNDSYSNKQLELSLQKFIEITSNNTLKELAKKLIFRNERIQILTKLSKKIFLKSLYQSIPFMPLTNNFTHELSTIKNIVPAYNILFESVGFHFTNYTDLNQILPCQQRSEAMHLKSIAEFAKTKNSIQKSVFDELKKQLIECIKYIPGHPSNRFQYIKDLTSPLLNPTEKKTLPLRDFPELLPFTKEIETAKKTVNTKSCKEIKKLAPEKNNKNVQPKKKKNQPPKRPTIHSNCKVTNSINNGQTENKNQIKSSLETPKQTPLAGHQLQKAPDTAKIPEQPTSTLNPNSKVTDSKIDQKVNRLLGKPFPYQLADRVSRWDLHEFGKQLPNDIFPEYTNKNLEDQKLIHLYHAPHVLVDQFLHLGVQGAWINSNKPQPDIRFAIPTEITFEGKIHRGLTVYSIDSKTNVCYHRCFTKKLDQEVLYQVVLKTFNENDFPELQTAVSMEVTRPSKSNHIDNGSLRIEKGNVIIEDSQRKATIKLFNTSFLTNEET